MADDKPTIEAKLEAAIKNDSFVHVDLKSGMSLRGVLHKDNESGKYALPAAELKPGGATVDNGVFRGW